MGRFPITAPVRVISEIGFEVPVGFFLPTDNSRFGEGAATPGLRRGSSLSAKATSGSPRRGTVLLLINPLVGGVLERKDKVYATDPSNCVINCRWVCY